MAVKYCHTNNLAADEVNETTQITLGILKETTSRLLDLDGVTKA